MRARLSWIVTGLLVLGVLAALGWHFWYSAADSRPIKIGILNSQTGQMASAESAMIDGALLAISEINARGGLLGRRVEPVIADGKSDWPTFASEAKRLITEEKVCTIVGCCTSASRKMVKPVVERYNHLLIYPASYEGLEQSPNIIYTGGTANQQIIPGVKWSYDHLGKRFFLVGSDYIWPHSVNAITRDVLHALGAEVVGEEYLPFGGTDMAHVIEDIRKTRPDVILSTVVGDSNQAFYKALYEAGLTPEKLPVVTFSIGEQDLSRLPAEYIAGDYCAWGYFQSFQNPENAKFVQAFKARYGADRVTSDAIESSYVSVLLWAQAVRDAGTVDVTEIHKAMLGQSMNAPEGIVSIDPATQHAWRSVSVGKIRSDGQVDVVWTSEKAIRPVPWPISRTKSGWISFLLGLYTQWGGQWANPAINSQGP